MNKIIVRSRDLWVNLQSKLLGFTFRPPIGAFIKVIHLVISRAANSEVSVKPISKLKYREKSQGCRKVAQNHDHRLLR
ncbi:MAG: hypothetical protein ACFFCQ_09040 [Promethearchaeota archaeon]